MEDQEGFLCLNPQSGSFVVKEKFFLTKQQGILHFTYISMITNPRNLFGFYLVQCTWQIKLSIEKTWPSYFWIINEKDKV